MCSFWGRRRRRSLLICQCKLDYSDLWATLSTSVTLTGWGGSGKEGKEDVYLVTTLLSKETRKLLISIVPKFSGNCCRMTLNTKKLKV